MAVPANKPGAPVGNKNAAKIKEENKPDNYKDCKTKYGTDPEYLTSVIARDRPDILERMKAGEFRSVRAAGIESGVTGPIPSSLARDQLLIKTAPAVGKPGGQPGNKNNRHCKKESYEDNGGNVRRQGNDLTYRAGRLKRDRPELAQDKITAYSWPPTPNTSLLSGVYSDNQCDISRW